MRELIFQLSTLVSTGQNGEHLCIGTISQKGACAFMLQSLPAYKKKTVNGLNKMGKNSPSLYLMITTPVIQSMMCAIKTLNGFAKEKKKKGRENK